MCSWERGGDCDGLWCGFVVLDVYLLGGGVFGWNLYSGLIV